MRTIDEQGNPTEPRQFAGWMVVGIDTLVLDTDVWVTTSYPSRSIPENGRIIEGNLIGSTMRKHMYADNLVYPSLLYRRLAAWVQVNEPNEKPRVGDLCLPSGFPVPIDPAMVSNVNEENLSGWTYMGSYTAAAYTFWRRTSGAVVERRLKGNAHFAEPLPLP